MDGNRKFYRRCIGLGLIAIFMAIIFYRVPILKVLFMELAAIAYIFVFYMEFTAGEEKGVWGLTLAIVILCIVGVAYNFTTL